MSTTEPTNKVPTDPPQTVEVGQVWEEVDPRHPRRVIVLNVYTDDALIRNVEFKSGKGRLARLHRFNGKRGGYRFTGEKR